MNKIAYKKSKEAGRMVCLFLFILSGPYLFAQNWTFDDKTKQAYDLVLDLQIDKALQLIGEPKTAQEIYVVSLGQALDLILTEDPDKYETYFAEYEKRIERRSKSSLRDDLFLQAEIRMQWAFVHIKFGHEIEAAWNLRQAYLNVQDCRSKFPYFVPILKTSGVLEILIGSVPEKYNWVLGLMNMQGSIEKGLAEIGSFRNEGNVFKQEADMLYAIIQGYIFQKHSDGIDQIKMVLNEQPDNALANFIAASLLIKNSQSEQALQHLLKIEQDTAGTPLTYSYYLKGEVYLQKGEYGNAITALRWFINNYKGQNCIKSAWYYIGLCYWLNGNRNDALETFKQARTVGKEDAEADKYASRFLAENEMPNIPLSKARYFTDGGFYEKAKATLNAIKPDQLPTKRDKAEYIYRRARLAHKQNDLVNAKKLYLETIAMSKNDPWYFAPNASLQLGYIAMSEGDPAARTYFLDAGDYPRHEYKNSIDSKAKTALMQLEEAEKKD